LVKIPDLTDLEPGLSQPVLREADAVARAVPQLAALADMGFTIESELGDAVKRALRDIETAAQDELNELAWCVRVYREAVHAGLATHDPLLGDRITSLESRIAEVQQILVEKIAEERQERMELEEQRDARRLRQLRNSVAEAPPVVKPSRRSFFRRRTVSEAEAEEYDYQKQMEALMLKKKAIADVVTERKRLQLQLEPLRRRAEHTASAVPDVRDKYAAAALAFERAAGAVAHKGLIPIYSRWVSVHARAAPLTNSVSADLDDPFLEEIAEDPAAEFDVFISHASEDKDDVARPLTDALVQRGLRVWLDAQELTLGDSLSRKIDDGLARSRFGVVILSHDLFRKNWPQRELEGLVSRETGRGKKVILPVWHGVTQENVSAKSPPLANRLAVDWAKGAEAVADEIMRALRQPA
jgi:hypothetical protein